jgi:hypothetical protein
MFGTKDVPTSAQVLGMLCPLFQTVALVTILVGFGLPFWIMFDGTSYGVFQICTSSVTSCSFSITELRTAHPESKCLYIACNQCMAGVRRVGRDGGH